MFFRLLTSLIALISIPMFITGQVISVKTLPLILTQQFVNAPSYNAGMANITIALDDDLADGFLNPARITAMDKNLFYLAPYRDSWSKRTVFNNWWSNQDRALHGSMVQALPAGVVNHIKIADGLMRITTGLALSFEQLRHTSHSRQFRDTLSGLWNGPLQMSVKNLSMSAVTAIQFPEKGLSVGVGVDAIQLRGVDGIPLLYPGARELLQDGKLTQYRLGISIDRPQETRLDILLFHKRYHMEQEAVYDWQGNIHNKDSEKSWLVQVKGCRLMEDRAQLGFELTGQWKWHPKIPDYPAPEISIPRDPGITRAGRIGVGFSNRAGKLLMAVDIASEIINSHTWGDTTAPVTTDDNQIIKAGDPLFRNDYFFTNAFICIGMEYQIGKGLRVQGGWSTRQYSMDYYHKDYVTGEKITATPQNMWKEPVLTGGIIAKIGQMEWIFQTSKRSGTGMPTQGGWAPWGIFGWERAFIATGDILAPPTGMAYENTSVVMHRLIVIYWF